MGNFESIEWPNPSPHILVIVPRFSFFVEDLVVGCADIRELGRTEYVAFGIESAQSPCNLRSLANLATWIVGKVCKYVVFPF